MNAETAARQAAQAIRQYGMVLMTIHFLQGNYKKTGFVCQMNLSSESWNIAMVFQLDSYDCRHFHPASVPLTTYCMEFI
jgi:hypothetical protein